MKKGIQFSLCLLLGFFFSASAAFGQGVTGEWVTIDDDGKTKKSVVQITEKDGKLYGQVTELFRGPDEEQNPLCTECPGKKKDTPIIGLEMLYGLTKDGEGWDNGTILDPESGKEYSCQLNLNADGTLNVRGYMGFSMFGRSQTWQRK